MSHLHKNKIFKMTDILAAVEPKRPVPMSTSRRQVKWTKNTSYAGLAKSRGPSETGPATMAGAREIQSRHETDQQTWKNIHKKSLIRLDSQRKLMEKSMLAYTKKMKQITDSKSTLVREAGIQNGGGRNHNNDDVEDTDDLDSFNMYRSTEPILPVNSAKLRGQIKRKKWKEKKKRTFSPIEELSQASEPAGILPKIASTRSLLRCSSSVELINTKGRQKLSDEINENKSKEHVFSGRVDSLLTCPIPVGETGASACDREFTDDISSKSKHSSGFDKKNKELNVAGFQRSKGLYNFKTAPNTVSYDSSEDSAYCSAVEE